LRFAVDARLGFAIRIVRAGVDVWLQLVALILCTVGAERCSLRAARALAEAAGMRVATVAAMANDVNLGLDMRFSGGLSDWLDVERASAPASCANRVRLCVGCGFDFIVFLRGSRLLR
jgi:hypothetical protein